MEAADMYLLPKLVDIMAAEVAGCAEEGIWEGLVPQLERVSQMPLFYLFLMILWKTTFNAFIFQSSILEVDKQIQDHWRNEHDNEWQKHDEGQVSKLDI